jgi:hypothetical protein
MTIKVQDLSVSELQTLISDTVRETMQDIIEDILALSSDKYLQSIREARSDYNQGKVKDLEDILDV